MDALNRQYRVAGHREKLERGPLHELFPENLGGTEAGIQPGSDSCTSARADLAGRRSLRVQTH